MLCTNTACSEGCGKSQKIIPRNISPQFVFLDAAKCTLEARFRTFVPYNPPMQLRTAASLALVFAALYSNAQQPPAAPAREVRMSHNAQGTFTVKVQPLVPAPAEGLGRFSINKEIHGDLEATTKGEMFSAGDPRQGMAGYVAIEVVTGTLAGKKGSFALQHMATMDAKGPKMTVIVTPGSGTDELKGIAGTFTIHIENGKHSYELEYTLPEQAQ
jgi:hypothetical protein